VGIVLFYQAAEGYLLSRYTWPRESIPIPWYLHPKGYPPLGSPEQVAEILKKAFQIWEDVKCSYMAFEYKGITSVNRFGQDEVNIIVFDDPQY
jgi:hypothetical protein